MAERDDTSASRKTARTLALTHRQHKATKRARPEKRAEKRGVKRGEKPASVNVTPPRTREQPPTAARRQKTSHQPALVNATTTAPHAAASQSGPAAVSAKRQKSTQGKAMPASATSKPPTAARSSKPTPRARAAARDEISPPSIIGARADDVAPLLPPEVEPPALIAEGIPAVVETPGDSARVAAPAKTLSASAALAASDAAPTEAEEAQEADPAPGAEPAAPARKMPTLAVMAALSQRAEAAQSESGNLADADERTSAQVSEQNTQPRLRAIRPTVPLTSQDDERRLDPAELDSFDAAATSGTRPTLVGAQDDEIRDNDASPEALGMPTALDKSVDAPASAEATELAQMAPPTSAQSEPSNASNASGGHGGHGMWWALAARRRAASETHPITAVSPLESLDDEEAETTAPDARDREPQRQVDSDANRETGRRADDTVPTGRTSKTPEIGFSRRAQTTGARLRARAMRSPRAIVLSWAAGGHAAVACVAALIAVIAALRGSAGPDALAVFNWSLILALIAGAGAAVGYVYAQMTRPLLATLALVLSQLAALAWALDLLGPRAALLALAPASAALALRGAGRLSAVATALGWMALFILDEALTLTGALSPALPLNAAGAALVDVALPLIGLWLAISILNSLYVSRLNVVARGRAVEHAALLTEAQLDHLRTQTEDDADALRRTLREAMRGEQPERVYAHGALSVVADEVNRVADRLVDLGYDRAERKRLESATRRLTRVIERAWLGLSWSWPDATGTILDDLLALLRTPPPPDTPDLLDDTTPTGQVVAPHLFRGWQASQTDLSALRTQPSQPSVPGSPSAPSMPSLPSLWPSDPGLGLTDPLELPPSPRWRSPDTLLDTSPDRPDR